MGPLHRAGHSPRTAALTYTGGGAGDEPDKQPTARLSFDPARPAAGGVDGARRRRISPCAGTSPGPFPEQTRSRAAETGSRYVPVTTQRGHAAARASWSRTRLLCAGALPVGRLEPGAGPPYRGRAVLACAVLPCCVRAGARAPHKPPPPPSEEKFATVSFGVDFVIALTGAGPNRRGLPREAAGLPH